MKDVIILGKGELAIEVASWFYESENYVLVGVVPDVPEPRWTDSFARWAQRKGIPTVLSGDYRDLPKDLRIDLAFSVFYGKIFKEDFINRCGRIVNLHNSPLPMYRGVRPINWALKNREEKHGVTIHKITPGVDSGAILGQVIYPIYPDVEEVSDVYNKALKYGHLLFLDVMQNFDFAFENAKEQDLSSGCIYNSDMIQYLGDREGWFRNEEKHLRPNVQGSS